MNRKKFVKNTLLSLVGVVGAKTAIQATTPKDSTLNRLLQQVGFNHLPNQEEKSAQSVLHRAHTRGHAHHGWLDSHHTFSFANYFNPERMNFGVLRVLNDDIVAPGRGFGTHPHDNMEIISIPLSGDLEHKDSMGNVAIIKEGDIQVMSAGSGIRHSEYNKNRDRDVRFLQIWLFPNKKNASPRYDQISLEEKNLKNNFYNIISPEAEAPGVWIHQNAWFHLGQLDPGFKTDYQIKSERNGLYVFVIEGEVQVNDQKLSKRDGYGIWNTEKVSILADSPARVLLMDVPMNLD